MRSYFQIIYGQRYVFRLRQNNPTAILSKDQAARQHLLRFPDLYILTRRHFFGIAVVIVTSGAIRSFFEFFIDMAVFAIEFLMRLIQLESCYRVTECFSIPARAAVGAILIYLGYPFTSRVTGPAIKSVMKPPD